MKKGGNMFGTNNQQNNNPNMQKENGIITSTINQFKDNKDVSN